MPSTRSKMMPSLTAQNPYFHPSVWDAGDAVESRGGLGPNLDARRLFSSPRKLTQNLHFLGRLQASFYLPRNSCSCQEHGWFLFRMIRRENPLCITVLRLSDWNQICERDPMQFAYFGLFATYLWDVLCLAVYCSYCLENRETMADATLED